MKWYEKLFANDEDIMETTKVVEQSKEVFVVKPKISRGGFSWEHGMRGYNRMMGIPENQVVKTTRTFREF